MDKVRIDKWLWAARFYKTRNLAKHAIEGGKVRCDGQRPKPSRDISVGSFLAIKIGWDERTVEVIALSEQRRGATEAQALYQETAESIKKREESAANRKMFNQLNELPPQRPTKKQRRQIHRFKEQDFD